MQLQKMLNELIVETTWMVGISAQNANFPVVDNPKLEEKDEAHSPPEFSIHTFPADFTLRGLYDKLKGDKLIIPSFQRRFVWNQKKASKLIESFLLGIPVPPVFLFRDKKNEAKLTVVDGQQRLRSIFKYFNEKFEETDKEYSFKLKLESTESKYNAKSFSELEEKYQERLNDAVLRAYITIQTDPNDNSSMFYMFERLNTGGVMLNNQEIRNCMYNGEFNDLLRKLNELSDWQFILGLSEPHKRFFDVELVLRCLSLTYDSDKYTYPLKGFLTNFLGKHRNFTTNTEITEEKVSNSFRETCEKIIFVLGKKPFHGERGVRTPILDSVFVAFSSNIGLCTKSNKAIIVKNFRKLKKNKDFKTYITEGTTRKEYVQGRISVSRSILFDGLGK